VKRIICRSQNGCQGNGPDEEVRDSVSEVLGSRFEGKGEEVRQSGSTLILTFNQENRTVYGLSG